MPDLELSPIAQQWVNVVLIWVGFGILVGLLAKALIPGREPAGAVGTLLIGVLGSVLGPLVLCYLTRWQDFNPISPIGFLAAIGGALLALLVYRLAATFLFLQQREDEGEG